MASELFKLVVRYNVERVPSVVYGADCHMIKSLAGTLFHYADNVEQVTVSDSNGVTILNLDKICPVSNISIPSEWVNSPEWAGKLLTTS